MGTFLLAVASSFSLLTPLQVEKPAWQICEDMEPEVMEAVKFDIISDKQANDILLRCLVNYS